MMDSSWAGDAWADSFKRTEEDLKAWLPKPPTDDELGRELYEREAKQWPKPLGWDNLSEASRYLWSERAREKQRQQ